MARLDRKRPVATHPPKDNGKHPGGAPSLYDPDRMPHDAYVMCSRLGAENKDIAAMFDVSEKAIEKWLRNYPVFRLAVRKGRDEWDSGNIEISLKRRAMGYEYTETKQTVKGSEISHRHMAPDVGACIFWLINRQKDRWAQMKHVIQSGKTESDVNFNVNQRINLSNLDRSQLEQLRDIITIAKNVPSLPAPDESGREYSSESGSGSGGNGTGESVSKSVH